MENKMIKKYHREAYGLSILFIILGIICLIPGIFLFSDIIIGFIIIGLIMILLGISCLLFVKKVVIANYKLKEAGLEKKLYKVIFLPIFLVSIIKIYSNNIFINWIVGIILLSLAVYVIYIYYKAYKITSKNPPVI